MMLSSSVRRAALSAPSIPVGTSISTAAPLRAIASQTLIYRSHQRRLSSSSSKPSSPADGSKGVADGQAVPASASRTQSDSSKGVTESSQAQPEVEKKASSKGGKKKAKDVSTVPASKDDPFQNLPSVPSTSHISPTQIATSSFFSLHRPISLTMNFPRSVTDETFATIFAQRTRSNKPQEVINTLSNTLQTLDSVTGTLKYLNVQDQWNEEPTPEVQHLDGESSPQTSESSYLKKYAPFSPPPAPVPMTAAEAEATHHAQETQQAPRRRTYRAILTVNESTHANGEVTYTAESSPLVAEDLPRSFMERMRHRQRLYRHRRPGMWAISVKRQRKLKMKKHKYKKLMRKTRNLRRRLDRN